MKVVDFLQRKVPKCVIDISLNTRRPLLYEAVLKFANNFITAIIFDCND